jgi:predicted HTH domain antitoxin
MREVRVPVPEDTFAALRLTVEGMSLELRTAAAMKLYELHRLSSGAAAQLAGLTRPEFLQKLGEYGVNTFEQTQDELDRDARNASRPL